MSPQLTDEVIEESLCHGIFMVIREMKSKDESIVFTPKCTLGEGADGTLVIHHDFSNPTSRKVSSSFTSWN